MKSLRVLLTATAIAFISSASYAPVQGIQNNYPTPYGGGQAPESAAGDTATASGDVQSASTPKDTYEKASSGKRAPERATGSRGNTDYTKPPGFGNGGMGGAKLGGMSGQDQAAALKAAKEQKYQQCIATCAQYK